MDEEKLHELARKLLWFGADAESGILHFLIDYQDKQNKKYNPPVSDCIEIIDYYIRRLFDLRKKFRKLQEEE